MDDCDWVVVVVVNLSGVEVAFVVESVDDSGVVVDIDVGVEVVVEVDVTSVEVEEAAAVEKVVELAAADPPVLKGTFCLCIRSNSAADAKESTASSAANRKATGCGRSILDRLQETRWMMVKTAELMLDD